MTRTRQVLTGLGALLLLAGFVVVVPWALVRYIGWPLPHAIPTWTSLRSGLTTRGFPTADLIKALALVVWAGWAVLAATIAAETANAVGGTQWRRVPLAGAAHPFVRVLVTAVIVAMLGALPRPTPTGHPPLAASLAATQQHTPTAAPPPVLDAALRTVTSPTGAVSDGAVDPDLRPYVVQRRDTLWGIAERQLGDPTRWTEIYALNEGRHQPGGQSLSNANLIRPGWTLRLPTTPAATAARPRGGAQHPSAVRRPTTHRTSDPAPTSHAPTPPRAAPSRPATPDGTTARSTAAASPASASPNRSDGRNSASIALTSGSEVGAAFAAAVLAALAADRLRKRRRYRPAPPAPGRYRTSAPPPRPLRHLLGRTDHDDESAPPPQQRDAGVVHTAPRSGVISDDPGTADGTEIGICDGQPVRLPLSGWGGLTLTGAGARDTARAWLAALVSQAGPYGIRIYGTREVIDDLLPGMQASPAIQAVPDERALRRCLEQEILARGRTLMGASIPDAASYRRQNPEDPLPQVLQISTTAGDDRWRAILQPARTLDIDALFVVPDTTADEPGSARMSVNETGSVDDASAPLAQRVTGARLFRLSHHDAQVLLRPIAADHAIRTATEPATADPDPSETAADGGSLIGPAALPAPSPPTSPASAGERMRVSQRAPEPAIRVQLLGVFRIWAHGEEITSGLRSGARELLAWYLLRPDGATAETAIEALWPEVSPERGPQRFWNALGNLRSRLRAVSEAPDLDVLVKAAERYRPQAGVLDVDVWHFQAALHDAAHATDTVAARQALETATAAFSGDLLDADPHPWAEPLREELHRRALDAHLRLAEIQVDAGDPDVALESLERAISLDPYAEEAYRRTLTIQADLGRADALRRTWDLLRGRLTDIDLDPESETVALYRALKTRGELALSIPRATPGAPRLTY